MVKYLLKQIYIFESRRLSAANGITGYLPEISLPNRKYVVIHRRISNAKVVNKIASITITPKLWYFSHKSIKRVQKWKRCQLILCDVLHHQKKSFTWNQKKTCADKLRILEKWTVKVLIVPKVSSLSLIWILNNIVNALWRSYWK